MLPFGEVQAWAEEVQTCLVELLSEAAKHKAFQASSRLRSAKIRLDENPTLGQLCLWTSCSSRARVNFPSLEVLP